MAVVALAVAVPHHTRHHHHHRFHLQRVELCEANRESGEPGALTYSTIRWRMDEGGYEGAYSWAPSTWRSQRFRGMPARAVDATPRQQTEVFRRWKNVREWPPLAFCL